MPLLKDNCQLLILNNKLLNTPFLVLRHFIWKKIFTEGINLYICYTNVLKVKLFQTGNKVNTSEKNNIHSAIQTVVQSSLSIVSLKFIETPCGIMTFFPFQIKEFSFQHFHFETHGVHFIVIKSYK